MVDPESGRLDAVQCGPWRKDWSPLSTSQLLTWSLGGGDILDGKTGQAIDPLSGEVVEDGSYIDDDTGRTVPLCSTQVVVQCCIQQIVAVLCARKSVASKLTLRQSINSLQKPITSCITVQNWLNNQRHFIYMQYGPAWLCVIWIELRTLVAFASPTLTGLAVDPYKGPHGQG